MQNKPGYIYIYIYIYVYTPGGGGGEEGGGSEGGGGGGGFSRWPPQKLPFTLNMPYKFSR